MVREEVRVGKRRLPRRGVTSPAPRGGSPARRQERLRRLFARRNAWHVRGGDRSACVAASAVRAAPFWGNCHPNRSTLRASRRPHNDLDVAVKGIQELEKTLHRKRLELAANEVGDL